MSRILSTIQIDEEHTSENLAMHLEQKLAFWRIPKEKIFAVVTDNGANIVKAVKDIAKLRHVPCFAHTLHLVVSQAVDG